MEDYNSDEYLPECRDCGGNNFKRDRDYFERQYLALDNDGRADVDCSDMEGPTSEWVYECVDCGSSDDDLENLLAFRPLEDECEHGVTDDCLSCMAENF